MFGRHLRRRFCIWLLLRSMILARSFQTYTCRRTDCVYPVRDTVSPVSGNSSGATVRSMLRPGKSERCAPLAVSFRRASSQTIFCRKKTVVFLYPTLRWSQTRIIIHIEYMFSNKQTHQSDQPSNTRPLDAKRQLDLFLRTLVLGAKKVEKTKNDLR